MFLEDVRYFRLKRETTRSFVSICAVRNVKREEHKHILHQQHNSMVYIRLECIQLDKKKAPRDCGLL